MKINPESFFRTFSTTWLFLKFVEKKEAEETRNKHQIVPVVIKVKPRNKKEKLPAVLVSINCGRKDIKNKATFGLRILIKTPSRNILIFGS